MKHLFTFLLLSSVAAVVFYRFPEGYVWGFWVLLVLMFIFAGGLLISMYRIGSRRVRLWLEAESDPIKSVGIRREAIRIDAVTLCAAAYHDPEMVTGAYRGDQAEGQEETDAPFGALVFIPGKRPDTVGFMLYLEMVQGHPKLRKAWDAGRVERIDTGRIPVHMARPATLRSGLRFTFDDGSSLWFSVLSPNIHRERFSVILALR